ncbi:vWA domain-containing protein [Parafrankia discariae]|uniref:vWA domain-containing protein n=1 Tax=Parafrankia discariae TaxID=365528 RepID=UPI00037BE977|nr:vWA domain-containing protein [Parafrankia discariae]
MYSAEINRKQPACLLLVIDHSTSMAETWAGGAMSKADQLALAVNRLLGNAVLLCSKGDDRVHDYFEVGILGYGRGVSPVLYGSNASRPLLPISEVALNPNRVDHVLRRISDGAGGLVEVQTPIPAWVDPVADGWTPMAEALTTAAWIIDEWCRGHASSFPPIVVNITDGQSTDGDPRIAAARVRAAGTADGDALLFNAHLSATARNTVTFPDDRADLPDDFARALFDMSSALPPTMVAAAGSLGYPAGAGSRGFLYNADVTALIEFLDIGTRAVTPTGLRDLAVGPRSAG